MQGYVLAAEPHSTEWRHHREWNLLLCILPAMPNLSSCKAARRQQRLKLWMNPLLRMTLVDAREFAQHAMHASHAELVIVS